MIRLRPLAAALSLSILAIGTPLFADQVGLAWDPSPDPTVAGYRLHVGTTSGVYTQTFEAGINTSMTVPNLVPGTTYFFAATAYNSAQVESAVSNEVSYTVPGGQPSPTPSPSPTPTPPPEGTFVKGINVNGNAATVNGHPWLSYATALANGFSSSNNTFANSVTYSPAVDGDTNTMLQRGIWCPAL